MKHENLVFVDAVLRNQHLLVAIDDKVAAEIIDTFVLVLFADTLHLTENAEFRAHHNRDFANIDAIDGLVELLSHPVLVGNLCGDMDVHVDTARIRHIIHTSNIGRHYILCAVLELIVGLDNARVQDVDRDIIGIVWQLGFLVRNLHLDGIETAYNLPERIVDKLVITINLMLYKRI